MIERILVIKHGGLGDLFMLMDSFEAIRRHHASAHITLLTGPAYQSMLAHCPFFDVIHVDARQSYLRLGYLRSIQRIINGNGQPFDRIYDLQCSGRTRFYFKYLLTSPRPEWVGKAPGCSHPRPVADGVMHPNALYREQLLFAGVQPVGRPNLNWLEPPVGCPQFSVPYVCLIPSCSKQHPEKRWHVSGYVELIEWLSQHGVHSVLLGHGDDANMINAIVSRLSASALVTNLCNQSPLAVIVELARHAQFVLGSDTGPLQIAAMLAPHVILLHSTQVKPAEHVRPISDSVDMLGVYDLSVYPASDVIQVVATRLAL